MSITLEDAKAMMSEDSWGKLKNMVNTRPTINMNNKVNCDILMQALCRAVENDVIHVTSLDEKIVKLLNSETNTLSASKLGEMLTKIREYQPDIVCCITLLTADMSEVIREWTFTGPIVKFNDIFGYVIDRFNITPSSVRNRMTALKPTIVNNISQFVSKYNMADDKDEQTVSITTISRLANMEEHLLFAEFKKIGDS